MNHTPPPPRASAPSRAPFQGYTIEEMRYRRIVNSLKIDIQRQRLQGLLSPVARSAEGTILAVPHFLRSAEGVMKYADMAFFAFTFARKIASMVRRYRQKK